MSHIFISYASADRARAKGIADVLASKGWSVWWDRTIPPGKEFDQVIEEALDAASCVVVLWSAAAVASTWVKNEAAEAMRRKILVPALIEDAKIPLEFRRLQAADLSRSNLDPAHPEFEKFLLAIESNIGTGAKGVASVPAAAERHVASGSLFGGRTKSGSPQMILAALVGMFVLAVVGYLWYQKAFETRAGNPAAPQAANNPPARAAPAPATAAPINILSFRDWQGSWNLEWEFEGKRYGKPMNLKSDKSGIAGDYVLGTIEGTFVGGDFSKVTGELINNSGTGADCPSGRQGGSFSFTMANDGKRLDGWWNVCGKGHKWMLQADKREAIARQ